MKHNFKRLLVLVCMFACLFALTACGSEEKSKNISLDEDSKKELIEAGKEELAYLSAYTTEQLEKQIEDGTVTGFGVTVIKNFLTVSNDLGAFRSVDSSEVTTTEENVIVKLETTYALRKMTYTKTFDASGNIVSAKFEPYYTFGEKMGKAGMNTLIGMGTVFIVLIGMSFIISLFKYIGAAGSKKKETKKTDGATAVDNTIAQIVEKEEAAMDDLELVAVITAAIAASEGTSSDGLVVRSIRKVNKQKWLNA